MRTGLLAGLLLAMSSSMAAADTALEVSMRSQDIQEIAELGSAQVDGIGQVSFVARRQGNQIIVRALGPSREVLGKAETTVGLSETPIYLKIGDTLSKFTIFWGQDTKSQ